MPLKILESRGTYISQSLLAMILQPEFFDPQSCVDMNMRCGLCFLIIAFIFIAAAYILLPSTMELLKVWGRGGKLQLHMGLCNSLKCDIVIAILQSFSAITSILEYFSGHPFPFPACCNFPTTSKISPLTSYLYPLHLLQVLIVGTNLFLLFPDTEIFIQSFFVLYFIEHTLESVFSYPNNPLGISCKHNIFFSLEFLVLTLRNIPSLTFVGYSSQVGYGDRGF